MATLAAANPLSESIGDVRGDGGLHVFMLGHVQLSERRVTPFSVVLRRNGDQVAEARAYLSGEDELRRVGHLPADCLPDSPRTRNWSSQ